jgi:hypothetical protein
MVCISHPAPSLHTRRETCAVQFLMLPRGAAYMKALVEMLTYVRDGVAGVVTVGMMGGALGTAKVCAIIR